MLRHWVGAYVEVKNRDGLGRESRKMGDDPASKWHMEVGERSNRS